MGKYNNENGFAFVRMETIADARALLQGQELDLHTINGKQLGIRPAAKSDKVKNLPNKKNVDLEDENEPTPITGSVIRVRGLPPEQKSRDVFKLFYNFSTTRIRDCGGDDLFVEFSSEAE